MLRELVAWLRGRRALPEPPPSEIMLDAALVERDVLIDRKDRILRAFREAQRVLAKEGNRRT